jgi:WD40 repeat protein
MAYKIVFPLVLCCGWLFGWPVLDGLSVHRPVLASEPQTGEERSAAVAPEAAEYGRVSSVLRTYCLGCHNDGDAESEFVVGSYEDLLRSTMDSGKLVVAGDPDQSLLYQLMTGRVEPSMPPSDQPQPSEEEIDWIRKWIVAGAHDGPDMPVNSSEASGLRVSPSEIPLISAAAVLSDGTVALGNSGFVELLDPENSRQIGRLEFPGSRVTALRLSDCQRYLMVGASQVGVGGEVHVVDTKSYEVVVRLAGHSDAVYALALSPDGRLLASGGYDRKIILWDVAAGSEVARFAGHQAAIYDVDFHPSGTALASASADNTVKLWQVSTGSLLNTFGQSEGEVRCIRFSPDGNTLVAGGADRQIRSWRIVSTSSTEISPMIESRFAHEQDVLAIAINDAGTVYSCSADGAIKAWTLNGLRPLGQLAAMTQVPAALCIGPAGSVIAFGLRGELTALPFDAVRQLEATAASEIRDLSNAGDRSQSREMPSEPSQSIADSSSSDAQPHQLASEKIAEVEPNDSPGTAMKISLPCVISGVIFAGDDQEESSSDSSDVDFFRFDAKAGENWIFEIHAARNQSSLDSWIDVLDATGQPLLRTRLQAVRESYFTFRGKDSSTSDDFRLHKWEDMELDEYLYANSEVTRLWLYPRGPDSGFKVYPGTGKRHTFFGSTPVSHALGDPAYIVRELQPDQVPLPNGLPIFPIFYENDDDPSRLHGTDSALTFVAPRDGQYLLRIRDARGFSGHDFHYQLLARRPQPDYSLAFSGLKMEMPKGSGREWSVTANRIDGLQNPIEIRLNGLPEGWLATNPVIIEAGQQSALGTIFVTEEATAGEQPVEITLTARLLENLPEHAPSGHAPSGPPPSVEVGRPRPLEEKLRVTLNSAEELRIFLVDLSQTNEELLELTVRPGETVSALLRVDRNGFEGAISFGSDDAGRNLPHGAFVDNIGLNGLLITEGKSERELFITAAPKLRPGRAQFHFRSASPGNPTSRPIWLNVLE